MLNSEYNFLQDELSSKLISNSGVLKTARIRAFETGVLAAKSIIKRFTAEYPLSVKKMDRDERHKLCSRLKAKQQEYRGRKLEDELTAGVSCALALLVL